MARFLIITLNYSPEPTGFAPHATALAEYLAARGHEVSVMTGFPFAPTWRRWEEYRGRFIETSHVNGVRLTRLTHFIPRRPASIWQRVTMEASFCLTALAHLASTRTPVSERASAILYIGAQPSLALLARLLSWRFGIPYFVNINDLASDAAHDVGIVRSPLMHRLLVRFERSAYQMARGATVLSPRFGSWLENQGFHAGRIEMIRSPIDIEVVHPEPSTGAFRYAFDIPHDAFVVLFAGSMGLKQGLEHVIAAAALGRDMTWVLVGDGEAKERLARLAEAHHLAQTVRFVPFQSAAAMSQMFASADVLLLNQLSTVKDTVVPSKLLTYMAAGRPIVAAVNGNSEGAAILSAARGGVVVPPEAPEPLVNALRSLRTMVPAALATMGERNRRFAEAHFDSRQVLARHEQFMCSTLGART